MNKMLDEKIKVTILTPTFNRSNLLPRLYDSLKRQSVKRFEWLIIDDGSEDNTRDIVAGFDADEFGIRYIYKTNGGKHTAVNLGIKCVDTPYTFIVDSDDYLKDTAIEYVYSWLNDIGNNMDFAGVAGVKVFNGQDKIIGSFPEKYDYIDCMNTERRKNGLLGDKAEIYRTQLMKENLFPEFENEKFIPETAMWNKFAMMGLKVRWYKEPIMVCEYLDGGLSNEVAQIGHFKRNIQGYKFDCCLNIVALKFPYNYSAASVFYAKCMASGLAKGCLGDLPVSKIGKIFIGVIGRIRFGLGKY